MHSLRYISYIITIVLISSCEAMDFVENDISRPFEPGGNDAIAGVVLDAEDNSIEHIRVTVDWNNGMEKTVKYTASDGSFSAKLPKDTDFGSGGGKTITITLDDIDEEANGGRFNSLTDNIVFNSEANSAELLVYRLTRAIPSENNLQP